MLLTELSLGLKQLGLSLNTSQQRQLVDYLQQLFRWNQKYNLTGIRELGSMVSHHVLDSLAIVPWVGGARVLDVGSGAGLPGIPLAVYYPNKHVVLIDRCGKKTRFLMAVKQQLQLTNLTILRMSVETCAPELGFDTVVIRAFASLKKVIDVTARLCTQQGAILAMKGRYPQSELNDLIETGKRYWVRRLYVPSVQAERHVVIVSKGDKWPKSLP